MGKFAGQWGPEICVDPTEALLRNTQAYVYNQGTTTPITLYSDRTKVAGSSNPTLTDANGNLTFWADPGTYDLVINQGRLTVMVPNDPDETLEQVEALTMAPGATVTVPDVDQYTVHQYTFGAGNNTLVFPTAVAGKSFRLSLVQPAGGGSRTITISTPVKWPGGSVPTLSTGAGKKDTFLFFCDTVARGWEGIVIAQNA